MGGKQKEVERDAGVMRGRELNSIKLELSFIVSHESHRRHFSPSYVYNWYSSYIGQHTVMRKLDKTV